MKGLKNLGNTCYFNSIVQCIIQIPQISNVFLIKKIETSCEFTKEFQKFIKQYWFKKDENVISPLKLYQLFKQNHKQFDNENENDAQEGFLCILDDLEKSLKEFNIIPTLFFGEIEQKTVYPNGVSVVKEPIALNMINVFKDCSITDALNEYTKWNVVDGYVDSDKNSYNFANVKRLFSKLPKLLVLSFSMYNRKNKITLEETLDMGNYVVNSEQRCLYDLVATCIHCGTVNNGHYVSFTKHHDKWYFKDDDNCTHVNTFPTTDNHYIVFYLKR